jgi:hypothetical protein
MILNEKNNPQNKNADEYVNKNTFIEIEKFVIQHEGKLYFYDALFDYLNNFAKIKKIKFNLDRDNPQLLGNFIENILQDWLKTRKKLDQYKLKFKKLINGIK